MNAQRGAALHIHSCSSRTRLIVVASWFWFGQPAGRRADRRAPPATRLSFSPLVTHLRSADSSRLKPGSVHFAAINWLHASKLAARLAAAEASIGPYNLAARVS